jgi:hypothetical protein
MDAGGEGDTVADTGQDSAFDTGAVDTGTQDSGIDTAPADTGVIDTSPVDTGPTDTRADPDLPVDTSRDTGPDLVDTSTDPDAADTSDPVEDLPFGGTIFFSEICDHTTPAARFVEIYNATGAPISLNGWTVEIYDANGDADDPPTGVYNFPAVSLPNGRTFVVARDQTAFEERAFPGLTADDYSPIIDGNDDPYVLTNGSVVLDIYGVVGEDGTLEAWNYSDRVARRNSEIIRGSTVWQADQWTISTDMIDASPGVR